MRKIVKNGILLSTALVAVLICLMANGLVYAEDYIGNESEGVSTTCNFPQIFTEICDGIIGGASWHIYSTKQDATGPRRYFDDGSEPLGGGNPILIGDVTAESAKLTCSSDDYYVAFGFDGRNNGPGSGYVHWGPTQWNTGIAAIAWYNHLDEISYDELLDQIGDGVLRNGQKISFDAVMQIHKDKTGVSTIHDDTGYFCAPSLNGEKRNFQGTSRALVGSADWDDTPDEKKVETTPLWWPDGNKKTGKTETLIVNDCDPASGCEVSFRHYLKRRNASVDGNTVYSVTRKVNGTEQDIKINALNNGVNINNVVLDDKIIMHPGEKVCETLKFLADGEGGSEEVTTTACAAAVATEGADLRAQIKDEDSGEEYRTWRNDHVYAKPGDTVAVKGTYAPYYQRMYDIALSGTSTTNGQRNNGKSIGEVFNANTDPDWNNAFSIKIGDICESDFYGTLKSNDTYDGVHDYAVVSGDVGSAKGAWAVTNCSNSTRNTPKQVKLEYTDANDFAATVDTSEAKSNDMEIRVPYNFRNSTRITSNQENTTLMAGQSVKIKFDYTINPRSNIYTASGAEYATSVKNPDWKLKYCIGADCDVENYQYGTSADDERKPETLEISIADMGSGKTFEIGNMDDPAAIIDIPDVPAGTKLCVKSAVYPENSGDPRNYADPKGSNTWAESTPQCFKVAKKPNFQVWGGSIYSNGSIDLGGYTVKKVGEANPLAFGSWTELSLQAKGNVIGLASGAALSKGMELSSGTVNDCSINPLSFENVKCSDGAIGDAKVDVDDRGRLIDQIEGLVGGDVSADGIEFSCSDGCYLSGGILRSGVKIVIAKEGTTLKDLAIQGDITYDSVNGETISEMPKLFIYAKNIAISCEVARIDAVLIAEGSVSTCGSTDYDSQDNSHQLKINGAVIANELILNRTYGATTGREGSATPAEIINYDPTLYVWSRKRNEGTNYGGYLTEFIQEVSPRL